MTELIQLSDVEIAEVAGGAVIQANISRVTQTANATNYGTVSATANGAGGLAAAAGAEATNTALVSQANIFSVRRGTGTGSGS